jgi:hypothetical protein
MNLRLSLLHLIFCFVVAALLLIPGATGTDVDEAELDLKIIVCLNDQAYKIGEDVKLTIYAFSSGKLVDADDNYPELIINPYGENERKIIDFDIKETGVYQVVFSIKDNDVNKDDGDDEIDFLVKIKYQEETESEYGEIRIESKSVSIAVSNINPQPGDTVDINVMVYDGSERVNADKLELKLQTLSRKSYSEDGTSGAESEELPTSSDSKGIYKSSFTIDGNIDEGTVFYITARATFGEDAINGGRFLQLMVFDVWYKDVRENQGNKDIEVYVADMKGKTVDGASIELFYVSGDKNGGSPVKMNAFTDSSGKAEFTIPIESYYVDIYGEVTKSIKKQYFSGVLYSSDDDDEHYGFEVEVELDEELMDDYVNPGSNVKRKYTAYYEGELIKGEEIDYYIYTDCSFIANGKITTNDEGSFELNFQVPENIKSDDIEVDFEKMYDYKEREHEWINIYESHLDISIKKFKVGGESRLTVDVPIGDIYAIILFWEIIDSGNEWGSLVRGPYSYLFIIDDGKRSVDMMVPEFLPRDKSYIIGGYGGRPSDSALMSINQITVKHGESASRLHYCLLS